MKQLKIIPFWLLSLSLCLVSCGQENVSRNTAFFKDTKAYELAKAVEKENLEAIEEFVKEDSTLLDFSNPMSGSNVLVLCLYVEKFESFEKLLELGANPNFINPYTKYSVLIDACKFYNNPKAFTIDDRYARLLLDYGANPNYNLGNDFIADKPSVKGLIIATSPLMKASRLSIGMVKLLIESGANPYKELGEEKLTPFYAALNGFGNKIEIINYRGHHLATY